MTLKEIADKVGVSVTTVSMVLNNKTIRISDEKRQQILRAAHETGYLKNSVSDKSIVLITNPSTSLSRIESITKPIETALLNAGYNFLMYSMPKDCIYDIDKYFNPIIYSDIAGIIMLQSLYIDKTPDFYVRLNQLSQKLHDNGKIFITIGDSIDNCYCNTIVMDKYTGSYLSTEHLLKLGHTRIAILSNLINSDRLKGYRAALADYGIETKKEWFLNSEDLTLVNSNLVPSIQKNRISAVVAHNDDLAIGLIHQLSNAGIQIPEDISVVGQDDILYASLMPVPLTTVNQHFEVIGDYTVKLICNFYSNKKSNQDFFKIIIRPELVVRETTAVYHSTCPIQPKKGTDCTHR